MTYVPTTERREQFIEAAAKIIREEGLSKATTRRIAQEAKAPLGSLHYCFRDKEELFEAVSQTLGDEGLQRTGENIVPGMGVAAAVGEILGSMSAWIADTQTTQIGEFEFYAWAMRTEKHEDTPKRLYDKWIGRTRDLLDIAHTSSDDDLDLDALARTIIALADGFNLQDRLLRQTRILANMEIVVAALITAINNGDFRTKVTSPGNGQHSTATSDSSTRRIRETSSAE
ncbi:TetR/AcrR family transcriptional regulator [Rhodococcus opacus]|uniref:TetR/AcrR family transcriptional regulator n=3 Tax=Rhodococcus opacus TaxID=37919 RepID=UPI001D01DD3D|nr:TetR/AcrR family transcriptional regulator [Rhodococcus opacus]UDH01195.1 TetR/AcrR family transcriptional regulator [Rhodococcus opacus PD630]